MPAAASKPPSWNQIRANARQFVPRWSGTTSEQGEAQSFWTEFLAIFGVDRRRVAVFEKHVRRTSTGKDGRIDLYWPGTLVVEHKSAGKSLADAEAQALDYLEDLDQENVPQVVITSDFEQIRILDLRQVGGDAVTIKLKHLPQEIERFGFIAGYAKRAFTAEQESAANITAAKLMGKLYEELAEDGYPDHDASVLLARLLFLLFGEDTGMWSKGLFTELIETRTSRDGADLGAQLAALFDVLNTEENRRPKAVDELMSRFPYVNGGLFAERIRFPYFTASMRRQLLACTEFDWGAISPAVFGSMFQAVKDKDARRQLGEHYTTERNILRLVRPLILDELRDRFERAKNDPKRLRDLAKSLGRYAFLDPACGCGNFLIIAYRELRRLELDIALRLRELKGPGYQQDVIDPTMEAHVSLSQFFGIELEEWPAQIAETAMFLVDHQANLALAEHFGVTVDRLPLKVSARIVRGNATQLDWRDVLGVSPTQSLDNLVILGNPPFVGMPRMSAEQQEDNRLAFDPLGTEGLRTGRLDYVACWYAKALPLLAGSKARAAFVSTSSITQGEQARTLTPLFARHGISIDFAHRTFRWTSEAPDAAAVHVVIVGFSAGGRPNKKIYDYPDITADPVVVPASRINPYLIEGPDTTLLKLRAPMVPELPIMTKGSQPTDAGHLFVGPDDLAEVRADPIASRYLRRFVGAVEMLHGIDRHCLWLVDAQPSELRASRVLRERLDLVAAFREGSPTESVRAQARTPWLFTQIRQPQVPYLAMPKVSSETRDYIPAAYFDPSVIAGDAVLTVSAAPLWLFAYLQSAMFTLWAKTYTGRLKSDLQILPAIVYFPFPFIVPSGKTRVDLERAATAVIEERASHQSASLADLYDHLVMPPGLQRRHAEMDALVDGIYGLRRPTAAQRMKVLMARYEETAAPLFARPGRPSGRRATTSGVSPTMSEMWG